MRQSSTISSRMARFRTPLSFTPATTLSYMLMVGNGLGFWNTIPTFLRWYMGSMLLSYRSWPSSNTRPSTRAFGVMSCMRFRQRRYVVLPHPEGPYKGGHGSLGKLHGETLYRLHVAVVDVDILGHHLVTLRSGCLLGFCSLLCYGFHQAILPSAPSAEPLLTLYLRAPA